ncbi:DUF2637 domain-containing protein [Kitasatospora sp. NPDC001574]
MKSRRPKVSPWDIAAVALLGAAGFALSYDALQQMAQAIHVRGQLSYLFPVVVDGFIAYGVRALVLLREAPWAARAYTWSLFAGATGTSVWANALHAIRLNDQAPDQAGVLRLGDLAVGSLSTIAPLALAGAVHLGIIVTRHGGQQAAAGPTEPAPTATALAMLTRDHPAGHEKQPGTNPVQAPALTEAPTRTAVAELGPAPDRPPSKRSAEEKLRAHRQGTRRRDRFLARLNRQPVQPAAEPDPSGPPNRTGPSAGPQTDTTGPSGRTGPPGPPTNTGPLNESGPSGPPSPSGPSAGPRTNTTGPSDQTGPPGPPTTAEPLNRTGPQTTTGPHDQTGPHGRSGPSAGPPTTTGPLNPSGPSAGPPDRTGPPNPSGPRTGPPTNTGPSNRTGPPTTTGPLNGSGPSGPPKPSGPSAGPPDRTGPPNRTDPPGPQTSTGPTTGPHSRTGPSAGPQTDTGPTTSPPNPPDPLPELLAIGRAAAASKGRVSRTVVATAIREAGFGASNERVGQILQILRTDEPPPRRR